MYIELTGVPVKKIGGDQGYSGNDNRTFCKENRIETSFTQKEHYGLRKIAVRIKSTEIMLIFFGIHTANVVNLASPSSSYSLMFYVWNVALREWWIQT